jgi:hypothetical protein
MWNPRLYGTVGKRALAFVAALALAGAARAEPFAEAQQLNAELLGSDSATATLTAWCAEHHLADPPVIVAHRMATEKPADAGVRALLHAAPDEPVAYRRVDLACGRHVLSEADNWYRPGQLTPAMNDALATTETPFGAVVKPLGFHRQTLDAQLLVKPGERHTPHAILRHRAVLETADGTPFSYVVETYTRDALANP